jgi:hypothetical protein
MRKPTDGLEALVTACRHGASPAACLETLARYFPRMRRKADRLASRRRYAPPSAGVYHFHELTSCHYRINALAFNVVARPERVVLETRRVIVDVSRLTFLPDPEAPAMIQSRPSRSRSSSSVALVQRGRSYT